MGYISELLDGIFKPKPIYDRDGKQIGDYYPDEPKKKFINSGKLPNHKKILIWMNENPHFTWTISKFQENPYFVGYEAPTRLWELKQKGYIERNGSINGFAVYKITEDGKRQALILIKELGETKK